MFYPSFPCFNIACDGPVEFSLYYPFKPDQPAFEELEETYDRRGQDSNSIQGGPSWGKVLRNEMFDI